MGGQIRGVVQSLYTQKIKAAVLVMMDQPLVSPAGIHSEEVFIMLLRIIFGPGNNGLNKVIPSEFRIGRDPVKIDRRIVVPLLPNLGIAEGNRPDTGNFILDDDFKLPVFNDFSGYKVPVEFWPLVFRKGDFLIFGGQAIQPENFRNIFQSAVFYVHRWGQD